MLISIAIIIIIAFLNVFPTADGQKKSVNPGRIFQGQIIGKSSIKKRFQDLFIPNVVNDKDSFPELWYMQTVDHFGLKQLNLWKQVLSSVAHTLTKKTHSMQYE